MKTFATFSFVLILSISLLPGCKKDKDDNGLPNGKTMKFTLNTSDLLATDNFHVAFTGADVQGTATTIFKVNGEPRNNQRNIDITNEQLRAGQVVIETTTPLFTVVVGPGGYSPTAGHSFSFTMEAVVDGKSQPTVSKTIGNDSYTGSFTY